MKFFQLKENDEITVFGLEACLEDKIDFYGFVIAVSENDDKDSDDWNWVNTLPNFITDNNVKICLESDSCTDNLTINGNNFSLIGEANSWKKAIQRIIGMAILKGLADSTCTYV